MNQEKILRKKQYIAFYVWKVKCNWQYTKTNIAFIISSVNTSINFPKSVRLMFSAPSKKSVSTYQLHTIKSLSTNKMGTDAINIKI